MDKKYVTNAVVYVGGYHSSSIIYYLVKFFGYNITEVYSHQNIPITEINKKIKNNSFDKNNLLKIFENRQQCSDMNKFPKLFQ